MYQVDHIVNGQCWRRLSDANINQPDILLVRSDGYLYLLFDSPKTGLWFMFSPAREVICLVVKMAFVLQGFRGVYVIGIYLYKHAVSLDSINIAVLSVGVTARVHSF